MASNRKIMIPGFISDVKGKIVSTNKSVPLAPWKLNIDSMELEISKEYQSILGIESSGAGFKSISLVQFTKQFVHPDDQKIIESIFSQALSALPSHNYSDSFEYRLIRPDGKIRNIYNNGYLDENNEMLGAAQDITDYKLLEDQMLQNEVLYHSLVSNVPNVVIIHINNTIVYVNNAINNALGYFPSDLIGKKIDFFISKESISSVNFNMKTRQSEKKVDDYEVKIFAKSGDIKNFIVRGNSVNYKGSKALLILLIDNALNQNAPSHKKCKELTINSANNFILSAAADEFNKPINSIKQISDNVINHFDTFSDNEKKEQLNTVISAAANLEIQLNKMIFRTKVLTGNIEINPEVIDILPLLHEIIESKALNNNSCELVIKFFNISNLIIFIDPNSIKSIFNNIISYSVDFAITKSQIIIDFNMENEFLNISINFHSESLDFDKLNNLIKKDDFDNFPIQDIGINLDFIIAKKLILLNHGKLTNDRAMDNSYIIQISFPIYKNY